MNHVKVNKQKQMDQKVGYLSHGAHSQASLKQVFSCFVVLVRFEENFYFYGCLIN